MYRALHRFAGAAPIQAYGPEIVHVAHSARSTVKSMLLVACGVLMPAHLVSAQALAGVAGQVTDSEGTPVAGASVVVAGSSVRTTTDAGGQFHIAGIASGSVDLGIRRLGFAPLSRRLSLSPGELHTHLQLSMTRIPTTLSPVFVQSTKVEYTGRLAGYYQRLQRHSGGQFISREEIDKKSFRSLSQLLGSVPGVSSFGLRSGGGTVRMRGRTCRPIVWLDGVAMPAAEVDLDAFPTSTLQGIELYLGSSSAPADFTANGGLSSCGSILLWSRGRDTEPPPTRANRNNVDLEGLIESLTVFAANQVTEPAELVDTSAFDVRYPQDLYAEGVGGTVVAEFVVDTSGRIEKQTFSIVTATNSRFSAAVERAMGSARYTPAKKDGRPVRQAVQQSFSFVRNQQKPGQVSKQFTGSR